jgi:hypothetical protein
MITGLTENGLTFLVALVYAGGLFTGILIAITAKK